MNFLDLPVETITYCLSFLRGYDLARLCQTCTQFKEISSIDLLWQKTCLREYAFISLDGWNLSHKELYSKVLHRYGKLLGLWRDKSSCYGGLVHIWYDEGCIKAEEYYPTKNVREALLKKEIFKIFLSEEKEVTVEWNPGFCERQPCDIKNTVGEKNKTDDEMLVVVKKWKEGFKLDRAQGQKEMEDFLHECSIRGTHPELCMFKWETHKGSKLLQTLQTFHMSTTHPPETFLPRPGLFKGLYGGHGTEIVLLTYDWEKKTATTRKISGDPNVPAGEISITADLSKPLLLNKDQQATIRSLKEVEVWEGPTDDSDQSAPRKQPFVVPRDVAPEDEFNLPKYCIARYLSRGTVSPMGYRTPQQIVNHFVVLDENTFVILWLDLYTCALFSRVEETFKICENK